ncbi:MAG TPA: DUF6544 family protein [Dermatophilaceae bacterium]|nr:DUF6544 family protein [Dermatophilaceae bacterium]
MRRLVAWAFVVVTTAHGLLHLLGALKGLGWAEVGTLTEPVSAAEGVLWLLAAGLVLATVTAFVARRRRWWWVLGAVAVLCSQAAIATSWRDAKAGTLANVLLLLAVGYGAAAEGPRSLRTAYRGWERDAWPGPDASSGDPVTEADLGALPEPVAAWVRWSGAVGRPRVGALRARISGRIRGGADRPWMRFTGQRVNTFGPRPTRSFLLDATMKGLPVDVLHHYGADGATMRVRVLSLVGMVDASGPELTRAETVTVLNDLCVMAPAALAVADVAWEAIDARRARATYTVGPHTVSAVLEVDEQGRLVDFVSDDRLKANDAGTQFTSQRWSTPLGGALERDGRRLAANGQAVWHDPDGPLTYLEIDIEDVEYGPPPRASAVGAPPERHLTT